MVDGGGFEPRNRNGKSGYGTHRSPPFATGYIIAQLIKRKELPCGSSEIQSGLRPQLDLPSALSIADIFNLSMSSDNYLTTC